MLISTELSQIDLDFMEAIPIFNSLFIILTFGGFLGFERFDLV